MISQLFLQKIKSLSTSVSLQENSDGFEFIVIEHPKLQAVVTLHGGHLIHFQKTEHPPLIWLSKNTPFNQQKAIRGGIPICWPWFGPATPELGVNLPAHGFARINKWHLDDIKDTHDGVELTLTLQHNAKTMNLWPHEFELTLVVTLNEQLTLALTTENKSKQSFSYRGALHTYLNISSPESIQISGLNKEYVNSLNNGAPESGDSTLLVDRGIDAIYKKASGDISLKDNHFQRTLTMRNTGNDSEVLWTPWIARSKAFVDMPDDGYQTMFCIESAITKKPGQQLKPSEKHTLTTLIE